MNENDYHYSEKNNLCKLFMKIFFEKYSMTTDLRSELILNGKFVVAARISQYVEVAPVILIGQIVDAEIQPYPF